MSEMNLCDAIKMVQNSMENFTDMQLKKFLQALSEEISKRKSANNYNPAQSIPADNAGKKPKKEKGVDKIE